MSDPTWKPQKKRLGWPHFVILAAGLGSVMVPEILKIEAWAELLLPQHAGHWLPSSFGVLTAWASQFISENGVRPR